MYTRICMSFIKVLHKSCHQNSYKFENFVTSFSKEFNLNLTHFTYRLSLWKVNLFIQFYEYQISLSSSIVPICLCHYSRWTII